MPPTQDSTDLDQASQNHAMTIDLGLSEIGEFRDVFEVSPVRFLGSCLFIRWSFPVFMTPCFEVGSRILINID